MHREPLLTAVAQHQTHGPVGERAEKRCVVVEERDLAAGDGARNDHVGLTGVQHLLGRNELHFHQMGSSLRHPWLRCVRTILSNPSRHGTDVAPAIARRFALSVGMPPIVAVVHSNCTSLPTSVPM